jgi:hypothetical protein
MKKTILFYPLLIILLWGCAPWVMVGGKYAMKSQNFEVDLPEGWRRHNLTTDKLLITKDGLSLQQIQIARKAIDEELSFTKKKFSKGMLPEELAEVIIDNLRSNSNIMNLKITENVPANIGDYPGFKLSYTYKTKSGLRRKGGYYGFMIDTWYYDIIYEAPARFYFAKYHPAFEKVKDSFRILKSIS